MFLKGNRHEDQRGIITFNNEFDVSAVKRIYTIENVSLDFIRGWQGHKIEQRWFACMNGAFEIKMIEIDNFQQPSRELQAKTYNLNTSGLDFLHIPAGHITAIRALDKASKLLVLADYKMNEIEDEYRFDLKYFTNVEF